MSRSDLEAVWQESVRTRKKMLPAFKAEQRRIKRLTGFDTITQSSYHTGLSLPDGSDFDMAIVGLDRAALPEVLARVQAARLAPEVRVIDLEGHGRRPGYTVRYINPQGIPVDLQIRRQMELDHLAPCTARLAALPETEKKQIVYNKYRLRGNKDAYLAYKDSITTRAGFPTDYWNMKPLPQVRRNAGGSPMSAPAGIPHADYYLIRRQGKPGFFFANREPAYYLVNNIRLDAFASTSTDSSPQTYDPYVTPWYLMSVFDHMTARNQAGTSVTLVDEFTGQTRHFKSISEFSSLAKREKGNWERLISRLNPRRNPQRPIIFLDLDNTLVSILEPAHVPTTMKGGVPFSLADGSRYVLFMRPGVREALTELARHADLHICTAATSEYADKAVTILERMLPASVRFTGFWTREEQPRHLPSCSWVLVDDRLRGHPAVHRKMDHIQMATLAPGQFIWVRPFHVQEPLDDKPVRYTPLTDYVPQILAAVGVEKRNPITVQVTPEAGHYSPTGRHDRLVMSKTAHRMIEKKSKKIGPKIIYLIERRTAATPWPPFGPGTPGALTLAVDPHEVEALGVMSAEDELTGGRELRQSPYTIHTILHRLGDEIMPKGLGFKGVCLSDGLQGCVHSLPLTQALQKLQEECLKMCRLCFTGIHSPRSRLNFTSWLCATINTRACREGWIVEKDQALAELVPMHFLYGGVKFLPTPEALIPDPVVRRETDLTAVRVAAAFSVYIDAAVAALMGMKVYI